jgi:hypothetical protein
MIRFLSDTPSDSKNPGLSTARCGPGFWPTSDIEWRYGGRVFGYRKHSFRPESTNRAKSTALVNAGRVLLRALG